MAIKDHLGDVYKIRKSTIYLFLFLIFCFAFLILIGIDAIKGDIDFNFFADTETYMEIAEQDYSYAELILINANLLGPLTVLKILDNNFYLIFLLNCIIFCYFFFTVSRLYNLNRQLLLFLLVLSPIMFGSLIGINKEIFTLVVLGNVLAYAKKRNYMNLLLALFFSFFVRWQMALFVVVYFGISSRLNPFRQKKFFSLLLFLIIVSIAYPLNLDSFESIDSIAADAEENRVEGSGLFSLLISIQNYPFGYILVFIPKALFLLGGILFRYYKVFDFTDIYNNFFIFIHSLLTMLLLFAVVRKKTNLKSDFIFMASLYCVIFCLSPIYAPRYLFPCYVLLSCTLANSEIANKTRLTNVKLSLSE